MFNIVNTKRKPFVDISSGWYRLKQFDIMLAREKNRSDRKGHPLSFVCLEIANHGKGSDRISEKDFQKFIGKLVWLISENTRDCDLKCLLNHSRIAMLLVDTSLDQARKFIEKLIGILLREFQVEGSKHIQMLRSVSLSSYPITQIKQGGEIIGIPVIRRHLRYEHSGRQKPVPHKKDLFMVSVRWEEFPAFNGTLTLSQPLTTDILSYSFQSLFSYESIKRIIDFIGAVIGLLLFSPLMVIAAFLIKLTSRGSVLFRQTRLGYQGKLFTFIKFRTMSVDCDESIHKEYVKKLIQGKNQEVNLGSEGKPLYKIEKDPRVTPLGHFLRKSSLDELPQLFNVLLGSMSLVGPRPPITYEVEEYQSWHKRRILEVKPGITGLWQVYGRSSTTFDEMVRLDLQYVRKKSLLLDLKILFKTFMAVLNTRGAL